MLRSFRKKLLSAAIASTVSLSGATAIAFDDAETKAKKEDKPAAITIIQAGTVLATPGTDPMTQKSLIIEDNKIIGIEDGFVSAVEKENAEITIINMQDKFVMPGLMDVHVHLMGRGSNKSDVILGGVTNAKKTIEAGFTTIREIGTSDWSLVDIKKKIDKGELIGPRIVYAGRIVGVGKDRCNGVESCREMVRDNAAKGAEWIKIYSSCSGFYMCSEEDYPTVFFDDEIKAIFDTAEKYRLPVAAHSHPTASAEYVLKYDVKSIEHGTFLDEKSMKKMAKRGVFYVPTIAVQDFLEKQVEKGTYDEEMEDHMKRMMLPMVDTIKNAHRLGVKIATGSDAGVVPNGKNYRELERLADIDTISNADVLKMATVNAAELLNKSDKLGTLEVGKLADIIAIDGNPIDTMKDIRNVDFVMVDGKVLINKP